MSTINYVKTLELYIQECVRQLLAGKKEEEILQEARQALGNWLSDQDKELFLNRMMARAKVRLLLTTVVQEDKEEINTNVRNMLLGNERRSKGVKQGIKRDSSTY
jgi:hypothetical protein